MLHHIGPRGLAEEQYKPDIAGLDGTKIYKNLPSFRVDDQDVISLQMGQSFIVYNPYNLSSLEAPPMHFTANRLGCADPPGQTDAGRNSKHPADILVREGRAQVGDTVYVTRCSADGTICMTAYIADARCIGDHPWLL